MIIRKFTVLIRYQLTHLLRWALLAIMLTGLILGTAMASAEVDSRQEQNQFEKGGSDSTITGIIKDDQIDDYRLHVSEGPSMVDILKLANLPAYFNILPPGSNVAIFMDATSGNGFDTKSTAADEEKTEISSVSETLPEIWQFLEDLSAGIKAGYIRSTEQLIERCRAFYTVRRMADTEALVPGWTHMASYENGKTLWHINVAMVALLQLDEYRSMSPSQKKVQEWIVFLHDLAKEPAVGRDHRHGFRSAALAGRIMPKLGFPVTSAYPLEFQEWFNLTDTATRFDSAQGFEIQDNAKLLEILGRAKRIFAEPTRTAISVIAMHQSITSLTAWPVKAPLTADEVTAYVDKDNFTPLLVMMLADSGGWNLFDPPTLESMYQETRTVFRQLPRSFSK